MASVPLPHQFAVAEAVTSININTYYSAISFLENPPVSELYQTGSQSVPNNSATAIQFDTTVLDTYTGHSNVTNNTRYTFQVAGAYLVAASIAWAPNATGVRGSEYRINGTTLVQGSQIILPTITAGGVNTNVPATTMLVNVAVNDYIEVMGTQTSGGNLSTQTGGSNTSTFTAIWIHA